VPRCPEHDGRPTYDRAVRERARLRAGVLEPRMDRAVPLIDPSTPAPSPVDRAEPASLRVGEADPSAEGLPSAWWLVPMLAIVAVAVGSLELAYRQNPLPPGVDPGDWIQRSFAWVGLPAVPFDAVGSPFLYPPG